MSAIAQALGLDLQFRNDRPMIHAPVRTTEAGTPYFTEPGVALIARSDFDASTAIEFLAGFDQVNPERNFAEYLEDPVRLSWGTALIKFAAQLCYMSFSRQRTTNAEATKYFNNIKEFRHGSVLEHANFSFLCYGISRSLTHELIRHRAGLAYSQASQRYVDASIVRFVERPEFQGDPRLHELFCNRIDSIRQEHTDTVAALEEGQNSGSRLLQASRKTDRKKKIQQAARAILGNDTEAPMVITGNARAWRHVVEMRTSNHSETEIRVFAGRIFACLEAIEPVIFSDYRVVPQEDGIPSIETDWIKV